VRHMATMISLISALSPSAMVTTAAPKAADPRFARLFEWMTVNGADVGPVVLGKSSVGDGAGAFVTRDVAEDELLLSLPLSLCIGLPQAVADEDVGDSMLKLCERGGQGGATVALAGFLAKEWLCNGEDGPYGPYLAMLPWDAEWPPEGEQEQEHVLWWSEAQVDALYGSEAYDDALGLREEVALASKVTKSLIGSSVRKAYRDAGRPFWDEWKADEDIDKAVRGAFVAILSRAFSPEGVDDNEPASEGIADRTLEPLLDMLQHSADASVVHKREVANGEERVVVRACRSLAAGEELYNTYDNELEPAKFLTRFGFVPGMQVGDFVRSIKEQGGGGGWRVG